MHINSKNVLSSSLGAVLLLSPIVLGACGKAEGTSLEERVDQLESREEVRAILQEFVAIVDSGDPARLSDLIPTLRDDFTMMVTDFVGGEHRFEGIDELLADYAPIMAMAQADLVVSAITIELDGDRARAAFRGIGSVLPPEIIDVDVDHKLLLFANSNSSFVREDGVWKLEQLELEHSLAFPGMLPVIDE